MTEIPFEQSALLNRGFESELEFCDAWCARNVGSCSYIDTRARVEALYTELFGDA